LEGGDAEGGGLFDKLREFLVGVCMLAEYAGMRDEANERWKKIWSRAKLTHNSCVVVNTEMASKTESNPNVPPTPNTFSAASCALTFPGNAACTRAVKSVSPNTKKLESFLVNPNTAGTLATSPVTRPFVENGNVIPSATGEKANACSSMMFWIVVAGFDRAHDKPESLVLVLQSSAFSSASQFEALLGSAVALEAAVPDIRIAPSKGGLEGGGNVSRRASTDTAPADWPKMVTFSRLPPKA
jgi:hypothetical protein